jgi:hypothetical protein
MCSKASFRREKLDDDSSAQQAKVLNSINIKNDSIKYRIQSGYA